MIRIPGLVDWIESAMRHAEGDPTVAAPGPFRFTVTEEMVQEQERWAAQARERFRDTHGAEFRR